MAPLQLALAACFCLLAGGALPAGAASLSVTADETTYAVGDTVLLQVVGDPMGQAAAGIYGRLLYDEDLTGPLGVAFEQQAHTSSAISWLTGTGTGTIDGASVAFDQVTHDYSPAVPDQPTLATVYLIAEAIGTVDVSWRASGASDGLVYFGLTNAPGTSFKIVGACGDGIVNGPTEVCDGDDGPCPGSCDSQCQCSGAFCGDGIVNQLSEICDGDDGPGCLCGPIPLLGIGPCECGGATCGDGIINQISEECDISGGSCPPLSCTAACLCPPDFGGVCGDGKVNHPSEECDGFDPAGDCPGPPICQPDCTCPAFWPCGNGVIDDPAEVCDGADDAACPGECGTDCLCPAVPGGDIGLGAPSGPYGSCQSGPNLGQSCTSDADCGGFCTSGGAPCFSDEECGGLVNFCQIGPLACDQTQLQDDLLTAYRWRQCPECSWSFGSTSPDPIFLPAEPPDPVGGLCQFLDLSTTSATIGVNRFFPAAGSVCCAWEAQCSDCSTIQGVRAFSWVVNDVDSEDYSWPGATTGTQFTNSDSDEWPDFCDNCPTVWNNDQEDEDGDALGNLCDADFLPAPDAALQLLAGSALLAVLARGRRLT